MKKKRPNAKVYWALIGDAPWSCHKCKEPVLKIGQNRMDGNVHHLDEDPWNNVPENLVVMHVLCHQHDHPVTDEMKKQISDKLKGRPSPTKGMKFSPEVNAKKSRPGESNPFYGKTHDDVSLTKMRKPRRRERCKDCGEEFAVNWIKRHRSHSTCKPRRVIMVDDTPRVSTVVEERSSCVDCGKPYAARWMQRHKKAGQCITQ